ncbi:hypothetical protein MKX03_001471 [Papaver bracteatum]|nr:hypothetical protein MKX03_001471 [Papaver bracteatum]
MRKVEELFLSLGSQTSFKFPLSFFTCDSLTVLDLWDVSLNVPNKVSFPRLKLLELGLIKFVNGISIKNLISNCPILEKLKFLHCRCLGSKVICIANNALKNLYINDCYYFGNSTLKICAPNLSTISYGLTEPRDFSIDSFPSLVEANIEMRSAARASVVKLLGKLSNVKILEMSGACFLVPSEADILLFPAFNNLMHLEVIEHFDSGYVSTVRRFFKFLQLSPNLESIVFVYGIRIHEEEDDGCWSLDPKCSPPHLKSIKLKYFNGELVELNAIKLILKYAGFLETVTIVASDNLSKDHKKLINVMKLLLMIPRPANCVVKFLTSSDNT